MHESRLVGQLLDEAERRTDAVSAIVALRFEIGAMAAVSADGLRHGAVHAAASRWGFSPRIEIEHCEDPLDAGAQGVSLVAIRLGEI